MEELRKSLARVKSVRRKIQSEFAGLEDTVLKQFLGEFDSPELRRQVRDYGDGYFLHPLPSNVEELAEFDGAVLIGGAFPKLSAESAFDSSKPLHAIPYWYDNIRVLPTVQSAVSGREYHLHFMVWQQDFNVHGKNKSDASDNLRLLTAAKPTLDSLFHQANRESASFIYGYRDFLRDSERPFVVITHYARRQFDDPVLGLVNDSTTVHIPASLRGKNHRIMGEIGERLP